MSGTKHEGVSCDACMISNFRGRRYKCLVCYDYDLCGNCRDNKATSGRHLADHPMQCILTRSDFDIYYGGESISHDQGQSFTCPYCGEMGFGEGDLANHVDLRHPNTITDVICPICSTMQGGDPNHVTEDLLAHLTSEHQPSAETPTGRSLGMGRGRFRRTPTGATSVRNREQRRLGGALGQTIAGSPSASSPSTGSRFGTAPGSVTEPSAVQQLLPPASALATSVRENVDSIAELLSQLTSVRRAAPTGSTGSSTSLGASGTFQSVATNPSSITANMASTASSLQQLQMQLQMERQNILFGRVENMRSAGGASTRAAVGSSSADTSRNPLESRLTAAYINTLPFTADPRLSAPPPGHAVASGAKVVKKEKDGHSLLDKLMEEKSTETHHDEYHPRLKADRALFIQELLIGTLGESIPLDLTDEGGVNNSFPVSIGRGLERENSADSLASSNFSTTATMGSSRGGSEFSFPVQETVGHPIPVSTTSTGRIVLRNLASNQNVLSSPRSAGLDAP
ncbi:E3 ubiquitin-protein ligase KCMF1-like isoform X2 [Paramacrobiotus metropolitanus]|uniref:E3 ubiquitin-protein ligase KCMF1-like isoform X2 n=1 Tax=Paramacrobiotus metropolitanus TaxID=2943436 RepID=UPI0024458F19|nr:E3 ubiquitin-protein ligase KCMF1-like isoform X2 [Paramacrobiotus metropolitanus]